MFFFIKKYEYDEKLLYPIFQYIFHELIKGLDLDKISIKDYQFNTIYVFKKIYELHS